MNMMKKISKRRAEKMNRIMKKGQHKKKVILNHQILLEDKVGLLKFKLDQ